MMIPLRNITFISNFVLVVQIKNREELEIKLVKAAHLRREATVTSTLFNQAHAARHRLFVTEYRQRDNLLQLERKLKNEKIKNNTQISKVVPLLIDLKRDFFVV